MTLRAALVPALNAARNLTHWTGMGRWPPVRRAYNRMIAALKDPGRLAHAQGHMMYLDAQDSMNLSVLGVHERAVTELVTREVGPGQTAFDVGANIGYFTLLLARRVGPSGRVFAFEPDPQNCELLRRNLALNGYANVTVVPKAVADHSGTLKLWRAAAAGDHRIYDSHDGREAIEVPTVRLDDVVREFAGPVHFIKMDIQGAEALALRGMVDLLSRAPHVKMVMEFWPYGLQLAGTPPAGLLDHLLALGFTLHLFEDEAVRPVQPAALLGRFKPGMDGISLDLYCVK
jgi:FkbM family methyltransferase